MLTIDLDDLRGYTTRKIYGICFSFLPKTIMRTSLTSIYKVVYYLFSNPIERSQSLEKFEPKFQGAYDLS